MSLEAMHDEIMKRFRSNLKQAMNEAENGTAKTNRFYFSDYYPNDDGLSIYAWDKEETAKRVVTDYNDDFPNDEDHDSIHIADIPECLCQPYIEGLNGDEMEAVATIQGKPFYKADHRCLQMTYKYDEELRKEARKLLVSDVEEIPFRPVIILKKIKFIENN